MELGRLIYFSKKNADILVNRAKLNFSESKKPCEIKTHFFNSRLSRYK